jgi:hypothetical protein
VEPDRSHPDAEGFYFLFNGVDLNGWWLNCHSSHSSTPSSLGPIFRFDKERKALYSTQRGNEGGVLMTKAKFMDYEIVFDYWPDWGNEAHLQHRTDTLGRAYNTTLGYMPGTSLGGVWGEAAFPARDLRPFSFGIGDTNISIRVGLGSSWTQITQKLKAAGENLPCPETGCTQEDWRRLWDFDNWNQIRVTFHGGRNKEDPIHARSWFRKLGALDWVPLFADTTLLMDLKPGYIGLLVHGDGRYGGPKGTWYRNIRWKPWNASTPTAVPGVPFTTAPRHTLKVDRERNMIHIVFANPAPNGDLQVLSLDGKTIVELQVVRGEAVLNTAGWKQGVYLLGMGTAGHRDWTRLMLP